MKRIIKSVLWSVVGVAVCIASWDAIFEMAYAATPGASPGRGRYNFIKVPAYDASTVQFDGGAGGIACIQFPTDQNTVFIYNNGIQDGGTSARIFAGFDRLVSPLNGMPLGSGVGFGVDVTNNVPLCMTATGGVPWSEMEVRWMVAK